MAYPASIRYPQAAKLASLRRAVSSPVDARVETLPYSDDVMVIETRRVVETRRVETRRVVERESMPPPYSMPTPPPDDSDSERKCEMLLFESLFIYLLSVEYSGTYAYVTRDKPPSYSSTIRRVQNQ